MRWSLTMKMLAGVLPVVLAVLTPVAAEAQSTIEARVSRLEKELRAVQRKVFGAPNGGLVEPEIGPNAPDITTAPGTPSASALADLQARVASLESQMQRMTGQIEESQHRVQLLEEAFIAYKKDTDQRIRSLEGSAPPPAGSPGADSDTPPPPRKTPPKPTPAPGRDGSDAGSAPDVEKPNTGDPIEDAYLYGYRLWQAKRYPAAETSLKAFVAKYPKQRRASYAQNLLGRAYLDDGKPSLAAIAFYDNYRNNPSGERAPDSLLYLAQSLTQLKKPAGEICKVYGELSDVYGTKLSAGQLAELKKGRAANQCK